MELVPPVWLIEGETNRKPTFCLGEGGAVKIHSYPVPASVGRLNQSDKRLLTLGGDETPQKANAPFFVGRL